MNEQHTPKEQLTLPQRISRIWLAYLKGQFILTLFITLLTYFAGLAVGLPYMVWQALLAGICENIPNFGPIIATVLAAIVAFTKGSSTLDIANWQFAILIIIIYILIQQLENWLIKPKILGDAIDINPLLIFIGMTVCGTLFSIPGMLLAVPLMGTIREIFRYYYYGSDSDTLLPPGNGNK